LASRTFTFLVGPEKEPIDIHIRLLQSLSEPLDKLMNNGTMKESTEKVAVLEEVNVDTFGLFAEFCYKGNYCAPPKAKVAQAVPNLVGNRAALLKHLKAKKYSAMGMSHDELRAYLKSLKDELSDKLAYHAKLYVFATMYMIQSLKDLCLHKLARDLEAFDFKDDPAGEFAELFRYVYVNTSSNDDNTIGVGSGLRDLVVTYAACYAEFLVENEAFLEVLEEGGEAVSAFAVFMAKRL
jgi:hypothetical protein